LLEKERKMRLIFRAVLVLCLVASAAVANPIEPIRVVSPLDTVERLTGRVEVQSENGAVISCWKAGTS
jgi:hypothetical protein